MRLLVTQVLLLALVCVAIGVATEFALQRFLMRQLDTQVVEAARRSVGIMELPPPFHLPPPPPGRPAPADPVPVRSRAGPWPGLSQRTRAGHQHRRGGDRAPRR